MADDPNKPVKSHYPTRTLDADSTNRDLDNPDTTDLDKITDSVFADKKAKNTEEPEEEKTGIYSTTDAVDQNSDDPPVGTPGHPGIDEDTA